MSHILILSGGVFCQKFGYTEVWQMLEQLQSQSSSNSLLSSELEHTSPAAQYYYVYRPGLFQFPKCSPFEKSDRRSKFDYT